MLALVTTPWESIRVARLAQRLVDIAILGSAHFLAFVLRFEGNLRSDQMQVFGYSLPAIVFVQYLSLILFGVPEFSWRYVSLREVRRIAVAMATATVVLAGLLTVVDLLPTVSAGIKMMLAPRGVVFLDLALGLLGLVSVRAVVRSWIEFRQRRQRQAAHAKLTPTLLIGAGSAGAEAAKQILATPQLGIELVGFLDDDARKRGMVIHGVQVLGPVKDVHTWASSRAAQQAIITIGHPSGENIRRIVDQCKKCGLATKVIPDICHILEGKINLAAIRDVAIEDLLQREPVQLDLDAIAAFVNGRRVLITGAGGSIGSELCRTICRFGPTNLILVEHTENNLFQIHRELVERAPEIPLVPCLADICDRERIQQVFEMHRPDMVLHAAAYKHVPMIEWNPGEAIKNNVLGTKLISDLADKFRVSEFVMISTDKAVNPTSIMGASKRVAEIYIQALAERSATRFVAVRFGNVLGSAGSVIPTFRDQIARGGPVTVTHPDMKRYFMTIPEACQLVLQAATLGRGGEIFILDMGEPVRIVDLARNLIALSGFRPDEIPIVFTGMRPGEKLFEELALKDEIARKTRHPKIFIGKLQPIRWEVIHQYVRELKHLADHADAATIMHKLKEIVPEFAGDVLAGPHHSDLSGNGESDKPKGAASGARLRKKTAVLGSARRTVSGPATDTTIGALPSRDAGAPEQDAH